ncbi:unnamed protein product [Polarella glacialis]|uniref:Uncharacterized protein n=1 Tax=Polarella glacialis TaxID=89957 RepID=A0A813JDC9_POLGL|nr:unnamed protein product [Polarella glacialis]
MNGLCGAQEGNYVHGNSPDCNSELSISTLVVARDELPVLLGLQDHGHFVAGYSKTAVTPETLAAAHRGTPVNAANARVAFGECEAFPIPGRRKQGPQPKGLLGDFSRGRSMNLRNGTRPGTNCRTGMESFDTVTVLQKPEHRTPGDIGGLWENRRKQFQECTALRRSKSS